MRKNPRPRIQRAFVAWWKNNRHRFALSVNMEAVTHSGISLRFADDHACLHASVSSNAFSVIAEVDGAYWDMLLSLDAFPVRSKNGYRCSICEESGQIWPSMDALWTDHLFEPFLQWVNERLVHSSDVEWGTLVGGST